MIEDKQSISKVMELLQEKGCQVASDRATRVIRITVVISLYSKTL
jgi:biotin operon repressor